MIAMVASDGCGENIDETEDCGHEVETPDGSIAYICVECYIKFGDDLENLF